MTIRIGTNEPGGTFNEQGKALAAVLGENGFADIEILTTPNASVANANHLDRHEADFGFMASNWIGRARAGTAPFDHPISLRMVSPANAGPMFFVTRAGSDIATVANIKGRRLAVGVEGGGMTQHVHTIFDVLGISFDDFTPVYVNFPDGAAALEAGEVSGISNISIVLRDLQRQAAQPGRYIILPRAGYLNGEPMACILPQDDSRWRDFVDHTLVRLLKGIEEYRGPYFETYQKWFGPNGDLHYPLNRDAINHFNQIRGWIDE